jgi:hypothetical protein
MDQMNQVLAAEGGYQAFTLTSTEWGWLIFAAAVAVFALLLGVVLMRGVLKQEQGTDKMQEIAGATVPHDRHHRYPACRCGVPHFNGNQQDAGS